MRPLPRRQALPRGRHTRRRDALDHLLTDRYQEDDVNEAAFGRAHTVMNSKLSERIKALP